MDKASSSPARRPNGTHRPGRLSRWPGLGPPRAAWKSSASLADLPADTGLAIVFVQHLAPQHTACGRDPGARHRHAGQEAADGMPVEANHVYVIPANADLTIAGGALRLAPRTPTPGLHMPSTGSCGRWPRSMEAGPSARSFPARVGRLGGNRSHQSRGRRDICAGTRPRGVRHHAAGGRGHRLRGFRPAARTHCRGASRELAGILI